MTSSSNDKVPPVKPKKVSKYFTLIEEDTIIEYYSQNEYLWNPSHPNYKIGVKSLAIQTLVKMLNNKFTAAEIHHRFSGMRTTYRANTHKVAQTTITGAEEDEVYVPTWPHYESMKFLDGSKPKRKSVTSYNIQNMTNASYAEELEIQAYDKTIFLQHQDREGEELCQDQRGSEELYQDRREDETIYQDFSLNDELCQPEEILDLTKTIDSPAAQGKTSKQRPKTTPKATSNTTPKAIGKTISKGNKREREEEVIDECLNVLRSVTNSENCKETEQKQPKKKDTQGRCDRFGEFVSESLKEMSSWNQTRAMADISNVLLKYDRNNPEVI